MVTLKGKNADRFIKKMIKNENSPISKADKKLAREVKDTMSKLTIINHDDEERKRKLAEVKRKRKEIEDKYNPTIPKVDDGLCSRCKKNKATINYTDSIMSYTHGFIERICQECYDKMKHENAWYKEGRKDVMKELKKLKMDDRPEIAHYLISKDYTEGWNACIKEMEKLEKIRCHGE